MKKTLFLIILALTVILTVCACSPKPDDGGEPAPSVCHHTSVETAGLEPTCTEAGYTAKTSCSKCGLVLIPSESIPAKGHTSDIVDAKEPTCEEDGLTAGAVCSVCQVEIIPQEVIKAAHDFEDWQVSVEATCYFEGSKSRECKKCNYVEEQSIAILEHDIVTGAESLYQGCKNCGGVVYMGHMYTVISETMTWYEAYLRAEAAGGYLATITSKEEHLAVFELVSSLKDLDFCWIGGFKNSDGWHWITGEKFEFSAWYSGQPTNGGAEYFLNLSPHYSGQYNNMNDIDAQGGSYSDYGFILEVELDMWDCSHNFSEWIETKKADCYSNGEKYRICFDCGIEETEEVRHTEHDFIFNEEKAWLYCANCDSVKYGANGHVYKLYTVKLSWFDAQEFCNSLGGHLVTISSDKEQEFVSQYMRKLSHTEETWIGAYRDGDTWKWVTKEKFDYTNWDAGQPDNYGGYQCMGTINYHVFGSWHDRSPIEFTISFICEWEP